MSWNFFQSWDVSWNLLFSEFCLGNVLEFFCKVHQYFFTVIISVFFSLAFLPFYFLSLCILTTSRAIISFSLFQKISNMAKRNCTFNDGCLIEFEWVEKGPNAQTAYCKLVHHKFDISNMGRSMVTSHSEGKKHKDKEISVKSLPISIFAKKKVMLWRALLCRIYIKGNVHLLCRHLQMCCIKSSAPCLVIS